MSRELIFDEAAIPIIIYQMGKVGSTALAMALKSSRPHVYQVHSLSSKRIKKSSQILTDKGLGLPKHIKYSLFLQDNYLSKDLPAKIITPIRSPIDRNISAFFQDLSARVIIRDDLRRGLGISSRVLHVAKLPIPNEFKNAIIERLTIKKINNHVDFLIEYFTKHFQHRYSIDWFDNELKPALGIDVYDSAFDTTKGYQTFKKNNIELLVLKSEMSNTVKTNLISDFLGESIPPIRDQHQSANKLYASALKNFTSSIKFEEPLKAMFGESKFVKTFYPELGHSLMTKT